MSAYKLIYFDHTKGRAEMTRLLFAAAGVKYEDCRVNVEEFQKLKDSKLCNHCGVVSYDSAINCNRIYV